jgi:hypothetical protein
MFRNNRFAKLFSKLCYYRNNSATRIQAQWKVHRRRSFQNALKNHMSYRAALKIQKYLKGLIVAKKYEKEYYRIRFTENMAFFDQV